MAWQEDVETGRVWRLAIAAEGTVSPTTLPNTGSSLDWTATASGENANGWTVADFELAEDEFEFNDSEGNPITVKPPMSQKKVAIIRDEPDTPDSLTFTTYEAGSLVFAWGTNTTDTSGVVTKSYTHTRRALIVELQGFGIHWFPSVEILTGTPKGGIKALATQGCLVEIFGTTTYPTGYIFTQYQDA